MWDSQIAGTWSLPAPHQLLGAQGSIIGTPSWAHCLAGHQVMIASNNTMVVTCINQKGHDPSLYFGLLFIYSCGYTPAIGLQVEHISSCINVTDQLSRQDLPVNTEWRFHFEVQVQAFNLWKFPHWTCSLQSSTFISPSSCL